MTPDQLTDYLTTHERAIQCARKFGDSPTVVGTDAIVRAYRLWNQQPAQTRFETDYRYLELLTATASFRRRQES